MNVDVILLCEYARIIDGSRLLIVGTLNRMNVPGVPARLPVVYLAFVVEGHRDLRGTQHEAEVRIVNQRREVVGTPMKAEFTFLDREPFPGMYCKHTHIMAPEGRRNAAER